MRYLKAFGLAVLTVLAAMAFVGSGIAAAEADKEIGLCEELVVLTGLCPPGRLLPLGTELTGLATAPKFISSLGTIECQDGLIKGLLGTEMGEVLTVTVTDFIFGKLPTPKLGEGCTGPCTGGIHAAAPVGGWFEVEALDHFFFKLEKVIFTQLGCPFGTTCVYSSGAFKSLVDRHFVEHPDWIGEEKEKDVVLINATLSRGPGGSGL